MLTHVPSEVQILGVYFPPLFVAIVAGLVCAIVVARLLNLTHLSRFFWHPPLAHAALWLLATALIGLFIISP
ncbi:MAG: DUF1656 domain-containing protein [Nitrospiraceae bacterium]